MKTQRRIMNVLAALVYLVALALTPVQPAAALHTQPSHPSLSLSTPVVDGTVDLAYGKPVAVDPAGDGSGNGPMDLTRLWVTQDGTHYFFAFEVNTDLSVNTWGKYNLYLDTSGDGNGATSDAWGRNVAVNDPHKPEFGIYSWVASPYDLNSTQVVGWTGSDWDLGSAAQVDAAALAAGATSIIEWSVAKAKLGNPQKLWVEVWSTGDGGGDNAQDTLNFPSDEWNAIDWSTTAVLNNSTPVMLVDGLIDGNYGYPLTSDPSGDGKGNAVMDLLNLFITEDARSFYVAYSINADISATNWGKYAFYIDTTDDLNGAASDAWGRNVVVSNPHKPEFGIYTWVDAAPYDASDTELYGWSGSAWSKLGTVLEAGLTGDVPSVIEWQLDKAVLGNPGEIWVEAWSTGGGSGDNAQDTINKPMDEWNASDWSSPSILLNSTQFPVPVEVKAAHDNSVWWDELGHDSRDTLTAHPAAR